MLGVKNVQVFSVAKSLEFPTSGKILTLPKTSGVLPFCNWLASTYSILQWKHGDPLSRQGDLKGGDDGVSCY